MVRFMFGSLVSFLVHAIGLSKPVRKMELGQLYCFIASLLLASSILLLLTSCQTGGHRPPVTATDLCGFARTQELNVGITDEQGVRQWMRTQHLFPTDPGQPFTADDNVFIPYGGNEGAFRITLWVLKGHLASVWKTDIANGPTFGQVVDGLGEPDFVYPVVYRCEGKCLYGVELDYPEAGISVAAWQLGRLKSARSGYRAILPLRENMRVTHVNCYVPGPMEVVLREGFRIRHEEVPREMELRHKWPGFGAKFELEPWQ